MSSGFNGLWLALGAAGALAGAGVARKGSAGKVRWNQVGRPERFVELPSDLFRESGSNLTSPDRIDRYAAVMGHTGGWGAFPAVHGVEIAIDQDDLDDYLEAEEEGYAHELGWSRPLQPSDVGRVVVALEDGHHRAYAAARHGYALRLKIWETSS